MYQGIVCKLTNVRKHENADRLQVGTCVGYQVVFGLDQKDGDLGVFFPCDGKLSNDFLVKHSLYRKDPLTGKEMGGYFDSNGRVRAQKLRGEISEGIWFPIEKFEMYGKFPYKDGDAFDEINGIKVCEKYYTKATLRQAGKGKNKKGMFGKVVVTDYSMFKEHYDTKQFRYFSRYIPDGAICYLTEKVHGSSGRTCRVKVVTENRLFKRFKRLKTFLGLFIKKVYNEEWKYVNGTRRVVIHDADKYTGYYGKADFRKRIGNEIKERGLKKGETVYYEIVGFDDNGKSIMPAHKIDSKDKHLKKKYGDQMLYKYGNELGTCDYYVYRMTMVNEDGDELEYSFQQMFKRCEELGLKTVPLLKGPFLYNDDTINTIRALSDGPSTLDDSHVREGVVVRLEHKDIFTALKYKGFTFCDLEGIAKNQEEYLDIEECS